MYSEKSGDRRARFGLLCRFEPLSFWPSAHMTNHWVSTKDQDDPPQCDLSKNLRNSQLQIALKGHIWNWQRGLNPYRFNQIPIYHTTGPLQGSTWSTILFLWIYKTKYLKLHKKAHLAQLWVSGGFEPSTFPPNADLIYHTTNQRMNVPPTLNVTPTPKHPTLWTDCHIVSGCLALGHLMDSSRDSVDDGTMNQDCVLDSGSHLRRIRPLSGFWLSRHSLLRVCCRELPTLVHFCWGGAGKGVGVGREESWEEK